ncbi:MAG: hypothetical protein M3680_00130 [Myxococcota bacterium]|nr:hypothetical protein [Myxococcota bacterium]
MSESPVVNPNVQINPIDRDGTIHAFEVRAIVKSRGVVRATVTADDRNARAFGALKQLLAGDVCDFDLEAWGQLAELGVVVTPGEVISPVRFACRLEHIRDADIPRRLCPPQPAAPIVNPTVRLVAFDELAALNRLTGHIWEPAERLVLVRDLRTNIEYPYWAEDGTLELVERLASHRMAPSELSQDLARALFLAGILVDEHAERFDAFSAAAAARYAANGWVTLPQLLRGTHVVAMREYYRRVLEGGYVHFGDNQVPLRFAEHNEPLMVFYHAQVRHLFEVIVGEPIKCSYPYFGAYRSGAVLEKHTDREQCEWTASLLIDELPRPEEMSDWSLYLELQSGASVPMLMGLGDGSLYKGRELPHYRSAFTGELMTCHFYHYVKADFEGPLS